uniref:Translation initiation factor eIF-3 subunit 10 n=1 Tax=Tetraselmis sp. GSL018 TaxID=582737 RepID=A0A061QP54_9CHLO
MSRAYRSGTTFAKPENALKRAEELEAVGQRQAALQVLHDVVTSKRHRTWQKTLEDIMFKYVDLSVEMKRGRSAKEALMQYRNVCQQVNVNSLEEVIKYLLKTATAKAEEAQAQAETKDLVAADLEEDLAPEDLMLSYVSGDKSKDRTERELVTPWFKFLWETYRNTLEILRNNSRLEALYAMTAQRAFQFCQQYKRTMEFRRLCDILRTHLANLNRYPQREQRDRPDLTQPDSLQLYLETRFEQLKTACELEMWQEAFRSIEDIHGLMQYGKKPPKPQMMATYYAKLVQIFDVSGSNLYHAYAWYKLFNLSRQYNKNMSAHDQQMMACSVLLAALSIVPYERKDPSADSALDRERSVRMAAILGFTVDHKRDARELLSRNALLSDLLSKGIHGMVPAAPPPVREA